MIWHDVALSQRSTKSPSKNRDAYPTKRKGPMPPSSVELRVVEFCSQAIHVLRFFSRSGISAPASIRGSLFSAVGL